MTAGSTASSRRLGETDEARAALEAFYQGVLASFRFLDGAPLP